jgi:hypothetical protein
MDYLDITISDTGPAFWVNDNQTILVYQNTFSGLYVIEVAYPSRYSFNIVPVTASGFEIIPNVIEIGLYSSNATFQVVANNVTAGIYQLKWNILSL